MFIENKFGLICSNKAAFLPATLALENIFFADCFSLTTPSISRSFTVIFKPLIAALSGSGNTYNACCHCSVVFLKLCNTVAFATTPCTNILTSFFNVGA